VTANLPRPSEIVIVDPEALLDAEDRDVAKQFDPQTGVPRSLRAFVVVKEPRMLVVPHFFSEVECEHLRKLVDGCWMPSLVGQATYSTEEDYRNGNLENAMSKTRTSWSCMMRYAQTSVVERLEHRVASLAGMGTEHLERMNMVRYAPGEIFDEHHDGKFRPVTVFVYLNDLPPDDEGGDTFFPYLGLSFKPRAGTAAMWYNREDGTESEDSRMLHAARGPAKGVKYGVNCFLNCKPMRQIHATGPDYSEQDAAVVEVTQLGDSRAPRAPAEDDGGSAEGEANSPDKEPKLTAFRLCSEPKIIAMPKFLTEEEADHLLGLLSPAGGWPEGPPEAAVHGPFAEGSRTLRLLAFGQTQEVAAVEKRLTGFAGMYAQHLAPLRLVRPSSRVGLNNRGCGPKSAYISLSLEGEVVFFPRLGMRLFLSRGDAILWPNVDWETGVAVEDLRTLRRHVHRPNADVSQPLVGVDAFFHDNPLREQQSSRRFVTDAEINASLTTVVA